MRLAPLSAFVFGLAAGCTPASEKVCAHLQALSDKEPAFNTDAGLRLPRLGGLPTQAASCRRQLAELEAVDPPAYRTCAKCIMSAQGWTDGWDCWVLNHVSEKHQGAKVDAIIKCDATCNKSQASCNASCEPSGRECLDRCREASFKCMSGCQFD